MCTCVRKGDRENDNVTSERGIGEKKIQGKKERKGWKKEEEEERNAFTRAGLENKKEKRLERVGL